MSAETIKNHNKIRQTHLKYRQDAKEIEKQINQVRIASWPELFGAVIAILNLRGVFRRIDTIRHTIGPDQSYNYNDQYYETSPNDIEIYDNKGELLLEPEYSDDDKVCQAHEAISEVFSIHEVAFKEMVGRATITLTKDSYQVEFEED